MTDTPTREEVAAFLAGRGYRSYPVHDIDRHDAHRQARSGVTRETSDGETKRGYFDVREWHLKHYSREFPDSYEVGTTFETPHGWLRLYFYSLNGRQLLDRLPALEAEIGVIQERLLGEEGEKA